MYIVAGVNTVFMDSFVEATRFLVLNSIFAAFIKFVVYFMFIDTMQQAFKAWMYYIHCISILVSCFMFI